MAGANFEALMRDAVPLDWRKTEDRPEIGIGDPICMIRGVVAPENTHGDRNFRLYLSLGRLIPKTPQLLDLTAARQDFRTEAVYDADPDGPADFHRRSGVAYAGFSRDDPSVRVHRLSNGNNVAVQSEERGTFEDNVTFDAISWPPARQSGGRDPDVGFCGLVRAGNSPDRYDLAAPRKAVLALARLLVSKRTDAAWLTEKLLPAGHYAVGLRPPRLIRWY